MWIPYEPDARENHFVIRNMWNSLIIEQTHVPGSSNSKVIREFTIREMDIRVYTKTNHKISFAFVFFFLTNLIPACMIRSLILLHQFFWIFFYLHFTVEWCCRLPSRVIGKFKGKKTRKKITLNTKNKKKEESKSKNTVRG